MGYAGVLSGQTTNCRPSMTDNRVIAYRKDIDGLRALAVLLVLVFHFDLLSIGKGGFLGVDIFFVISGFLITTIIKKQLDQDRFSFKNFYAKRIRRLAPALFAVLFAVMVAGSVLLFPTDLMELSKELLATQFYFSNFYFWQNINYFGLKAESIPLLHTWSLAVEEQFYLFFPVIVFFIYRYFKNYFWHVIAAGAIISFGLNIFFVDSKPEMTFYLMPTRAWELLLGSLIVPLLNHPVVKNKKNSELLGYLGVALIILSVIFYTDEIAFPGYYALLPTFGSMLLILSGGKSHSFVDKIFSHNLVVYIGQLSYSLYLVHWPINIFASNIFHEEYSLFLRLCMFGLSFLFSIILYHFVENPFRKGSVQPQGQRIAVLYSTGLVLTLIFFTTVHISRGLPNRFPENILAIAESVHDQSPNKFECVYENESLESGDGFCQIGASDREPTWLLYGDSHAWSTKDAFDIWLTKNGQAGLFVWLQSCPPVRDAYVYKIEHDCGEFNNKVLDYIKHSDKIKNIILASTWIYPYNARLTYSSNVKLDKEQSIEFFDKQFSKTIEYLSALNKTIYIWEPVPGAKGNVPTMLARATLNAEPESGLEYSLDEYKQRFGFFFKALNKNKALIHQSFSPGDVLCVEQKCKVAMGGKPLYIDDAHLSYSFREYWADIMDKQIQQTIKVKQEQLKTAHHLFQPPSHDNCVVF